MISLSALRQKPYAASESGAVARDFSDNEFTGRIDHRLSLVFFSLFMLVLLVGGSSLYLLSSHLLKANAIAKQREQVHIVEQIDRFPSSQGKRHRKTERASSYRRTNRQISTAFHFRDSAGATTGKDDSDRADKHFLDRP